MIEEDDMTLIYKLIMKSGPEAEKVYKLEKDEFVIGRELINDLIISDPEVSRKHARLFKKNEQYYVEDLNSTNGIPCWKTDHQTHFAEKWGFDRSGQKRCS